MHLPSSSERVRMPLARGGRELFLHNGFTRHASGRLTPFFIISTLQLLLAEQLTPKFVLKRVLRGPRASPRTFVAV